MKKWLLPMLACCLLIPGLAAAAALDTLYLSARDCADASALPADAVAWTKSGDNWYLLMPGLTDWENTRLWFTGDDRQITVNGTVMHSGDRISGLSDGSVLTVASSKKSFSVTVMEGSALSVMYVATQSGSMTYVDKKKGNQEAGSMLFLNADGSTVYDGGMERISLRGNTAPNLRKKNYNIKLTEGVNLMKMGKAKRWVLLGSDRDHSLLRNQICYNMAAYAGLTYTPETAQIDVYFNHSYQGTYLLTEKIEIDDDRVNIADLEAANKAANDQPLSSYPIVGNKGKAKKNTSKAYQLPNDPEDITGGYIIEYENYRVRYGSVSAAYNTARGKVIIIHEPKHISVGEMTYISTFIQGYENAIFAKDGIDSKSGKRYDEFVDFNSLVLKYMLEEISMNAEDGNSSSQYYYKPSDEESTVAFAGPCWDYDATFACFTSSEARSRILRPDIFHLNNNSDTTNYWWPELYKKPEFYAAVCTAWKEIYGPAVQILLGNGTDPSGRLLSIDQYAANIAKSAAMNFIRWPISGSGATKNNKRTGLTFEANLEYLKSIISKRYDFIQSHWGKE